MRFSTKGRYGLRAMIDLTLNSRGEPVPLHSIAERQGVSANYLEAVFSTLKKSGLVISAKGAQGGYMLFDNPANITVGHILRVLEGPLSLTDPRSDDSLETETVIQQCIRANVWDRMNQALNGVVDAITLSDLARDYNG